MIPAEAGQDWVHVGARPGQGGGEYEYEAEGGGGACCPLLVTSLFTGIPQSVLLVGPGVEREAASGAKKLELHSVLNAFQHSPQYGVHVCESFKDPRKHHMDDYWDEVQYEAMSIDELHKLVGGFQGPELSDAARARLHQFARLLERLSRRIDRVVLQY